MEKVTKILELAEQGIPQALARFNDGEVGIMFNKDFVAARGDQKGSIELQIALRDAICHEQENYWKGYPCPVCMKKQYYQIIDAGYYNTEYEYNTFAVVNTNRNLDCFQEGLQQALNGKQVIWVSGSDQKLIPLRFNIVEHVLVPLKNAWQEYNKTIQTCQEFFMPNRVFLFSCGPMARVLVKNLFQIRPDCTFLDIGSTYDSITRDIWHRCHLKTLKECKGCN